MKEVELSDGRKVTVRSITFGEMNDILRQATKIKTIGRETVTEMDWITFKELLISKSTGMSIEEVRKLSIKDGEKLFTVASELNPLAQARKEDTQ